MKHLKEKKKKPWFWPSKKWEVPAVIVFASMIGLGIFTLKVSNATSYLSDDPQTCVNCHVMTPHYMTWNKSSHREIAHCNDCHVPHDNVANKYFFKAKDGLYHAYVFTTRQEPQVIKAKPASVAVIQNNCVRCHMDQVTDPKASTFVANHIQNRTDRTCWECHNEVPHGKVKSLASVGYQIEPIKEYSDNNKGIIPAWLKSAVKSEENKEKIKK